tara:strand:+ start:48110 stop:49327 length:1218 start_codon:yes stop_codon:yes gene_type:complete
MASKKKVVVVGANFAGLSCSMKLSSRYDVTVIDPVADFEFLPNIHELLSGVKTPELLRLPRGRIIRRNCHQFVQDSVSDIDAQAGRVRTATGKEYAFDACVVAVGGVNNTYGLPGVEAYSLPFKSVDDCYEIATRADALVDGGKAASIVIVGGGLEGVEALGELLRKYRNVETLSVHLVEGSDTLLPGIDPALSAQVQQKCEPYAVTFHLGESVKSLTRTRVRLASGKSLKSDLTLWTGGAAPSPLLFSSGLSADSRSWAAVKPTLQSEAFPNVFVTGDAAKLPAPVSKQAYHALDMGAHAAQNVKRYLAGDGLKSFRSGPEISLISLGDIDTYLLLGKRILAGPALAPAKEVIFQANMARIDPPLGLNAAMDLKGRYWQGLRKLALPAIWPPSSLKRLKNLRML